MFDLCKLNFKLIKEKICAEFLRNKMKKDNGLIVCTQKGLIKKTSSPQEWKTAVHTQSPRLTPAWEHAPRSPATDKRYLTPRPSSSDGESSSSSSSRRSNQGRGSSQSSFYFPFSSGRRNLPPCSSGRGGTRGGIPYLPNLYAKDDHYYGTQGQYYHGGDEHYWWYV